MTLNVTLQSWQSIAVICATTFAFIALLINALQLKRNTDFQKQVATKVTYREYLKLACEYPKFADGRCSFSDELEQSRYEWFVSFFLLAAEEVLQYASYDLDWVEAIKEELNRHAAYLAGDYFQNTEIHFYYRSLQNVIQSILAEQRQRTT